MKRFSFAVFILLFSHFFVAGGETIDEILNIELECGNSNEAIMILAPEFPFITNQEIDDAIHTLLLFDADSLISVRPDTNMFFQHDGTGMKPILNQEKFTKLEREALFRYTGGITLTKSNFYLTQERVIGGKVGHIVLDQKSAMGINTDFDLALIKLISEKL